MQFKGPQARHVPVHLPARSLLVMGGEARYIWTHGITPHKMDVVKDPVTGGLTLMHRWGKGRHSWRKVPHSAFKLSLNGFHRCHRDRNMSTSGPSLKAQMGQ